MAAILGQIAFDDRPVESRRVRRALSNDLPRGAPPHLVCDTPRACLARRGGHSHETPGLPSVVLDGALHATEDLCERLGRPMETPEAILLAQAWSKWGESTPRQFLGDYAAVLHDEEADTAVLLRDHIGTRPLYWHWQNKRLSFVTFLPDLLALLPERPGPNEDAVAAFLRYPTAIGPYTMFEGIQAVQPGHSVVVDTSGPRVARWWHPEAARDIRFAHTAEYTTAFRNLVEQAVADRLPSIDSTVGAHLSGGIDSTGVAIIAQQALMNRDRALRSVYSWSPALSPEAPDMGASDERPRVEEICTEAGLPVRFGTLSGKDQWSCLARHIEEEGLADVTDEFSILDHAHRDGVEVLLSGWGGDEGFSAHAHSLPAWHLSQRRYGQLLSLARANGGLRRPDLMAGLLWKYAVVPLLPDRIYGQVFPLTSPNRDNRYTSKALAARPPLAGLPSDPRLADDPRKHLRGLLDLHHIGERMATWAAWSAPKGIEYRYPLTDRRLLEFIHGIPPEVLWGDGHSRYLARATLQGRFKGRLSKSDPANERKRLQALRGCWRILAQEAADGVFDGSCPWLDMPALRRDLLAGPSGDDQADVRLFIHIFPAMRVWHMAERFEVLERTPRKTG